MKSHLYHLFFYKAIQPIVRKKIDDGAWQAHSEILLLHLLASEEESHRRFAVNKLLSIRGESEYRETGLRPFKVPKLNWSAKKIGYVHARCEARKLVPKFHRRGDFDAIIS